MKNIITIAAKNRQKNQDTNPLNKPPNGSLYKRGILASQTLPRTEDFLYPERLQARKDIKVRTKVEGESFRPYYQCLVQT